MEEDYGLFELGNGLSKQKLLPATDLDAGDKRLLENSFNIKYRDTEKWIPRNKLHLVLAAHENTFRTIFYMADDSSFAKTKIDEFKRILKDQREKKSIDKNIAGLLKNGDTMYSNFGIATLGYIDATEEHVISHIIRVDGYDTSQVFSRHSKEYNVGHSEAKIFDRVYWILEKTDFFENKNYIILDLHSTLSPCRCCYRDAGKLLEKFNAKFKNEKTLKINISYTAKDYIPKDEDKIKNVISEQIELAFVKASEPRGSLVLDLQNNFLKPNEFDDSLEFDWQLVENAVLSSGWTNYVTAIENARNQLIYRKDLLEQEIISELSYEDFAVPYKGKWIPRLKMHRILAAHSNTIRAIFYIEMSEEKRNNLFDEYRLNLEKTLDQREATIEIRNFENYPNFAISLQLLAGWMLPIMLFL